MKTPERLLVAGIDIGSTYTKAVLIDADEQVISSTVRHTGYKPAAAAQTALRTLAELAGVRENQVGYTAATGYGRYMVPFRHVTITELTSHAFATVTRFPQVRTILDIGGQDIKAMRVDEKGRVTAFRLNDKCAAGTGAFLEKTAYYLGLTTPQIGQYAGRSTSPVQVSSVCAVFAEGEVISHLAAGVAAEDVMMGAIEALAGRAVRLVRRVGFEPGFALTGGMTQNAAMVAAVEKALGSPLSVPEGEHGQLSGAYGAALLGLRRAEHLLMAGRAIPPADVPESRPVFSGRRRWSSYAAPSAGLRSPGASPVLVELVSRRDAVGARASGNAAPRSHPAVAGATGQRSPSCSSCQISQ